MAWLGGPGGTLSCSELWVWYSLAILALGLITMNFTQCLSIPHPGESGGPVWSDLCIVFTVSEPWNQAGNWALRPLRNGCHVKSSPWCLESGF